MASIKPIKKPCHSGQRYQALRQSALLAPDRGSLLTLIDLLAPLVGLTAGVFNHNECLI